MCRLSSVLESREGCCWQDPNNRKLEQTRPRGVNCDHTHPTHLSQQLNWTKLQL